MLDISADSSPPQSVASPAIRSTGRDLLLVSGLCAALLLPFVNQPFNLDDPLFIWAAQQIRAHPADPYGFELNWYGDVSPMHRIMQNPPGAAYLIAGACALFGCSEPALHAVFLLVAWGAVVGTYCVARLLSPRPLLAALLTLLAPAFLVLAGTVMSDVLMLALWIWAIYFWLRGAKENRLRLAWLSAGLMAGAMLSKYFAISLLPLLLADALFRRPRRMGYLLPMLLPVGVLATYHFATARLYGHSLLTEAAGYASQHHRPWQWLSGLTLVGGCAASVLFYLLAARWRTNLWLFAAGACVFGEILYLLGPLLPQPVVIDQHIDWPFLVQWSIWLSAGCLLIGIVVREMIRRWNDPDMRLLGLWVLGTASFGIAVNWTANSRSLLPMVPALAIVISRIPVRRTVHRRWLEWAPLLPAGVLAALCLWASGASAEASRSLAQLVSARAQTHQRDVRFAGHWGFQYYMQQFGHRPIDYSRIELKPGTLLALPRNNTNVVPLPEPAARIEDDVQVQPLPFFTLMHDQLHAGFHSDTFGPLPFAFGRVPPAECILQSSLTTIQNKSLVDLYRQ